MSGAARVPDAPPAETEARRMPAKARFPPMLQARYSAFKRRRHAHAGEYCGLL